MIQASSSFIFDPSFQHEMAASRTSISSVPTQSDLVSRSLDRADSTFGPPLEGLPPIATPPPSSAQQALCARVPTTTYHGTPWIATETIPPYPLYYGHTMTRTTRRKKHLRLRAFRGSIVCFLYSQNFITGSWGNDYQQEAIETTINAALLEHLKVKEAPHACTLMIPMGPGWEMGQQAQELALKMIYTYLDPGISLRTTGYLPVKVAGGDGYWVFEATQGTQEVSHAWIPEEVISWSTDHERLMIGTQPASYTKVTLTVQPRTTNDLSPRPTWGPRVFAYPIQPRDNKLESSILRRASSGMSQRQGLLTLTAGRGAAVVFLYGENWITGGYNEDFSDVTSWVRVMSEAAERKEPVIRISYMYPNSWVSGTMFKDELRSVIVRLYPFYSLGEGEAYQCLITGDGQATFSASIENSFISFYAFSPDGMAPTGVAVINAPSNIRQQLDTLTLTGQSDVNAIFLFSDSGWITGQTSPLNFEALAEMANRKGPVVGWSIIISEDSTYYSTRGRVLDSQIRARLQDLFGTGVASYENSYSCLLRNEREVYFTAREEDLRIEYGYTVMSDDTAQSMEPWMNKTLGR